MHRQKDKCNDGYTTYTSWNLLTLHLSSRLFYYLPWGGLSTYFTRNPIIDNWLLALMFQGPRVFIYPSLSWDFSSALKVLSISILSNVFVIPSTCSSSSLPYEVVNLVLSPTEVRLGKPVISNVPLTFNIVCRKSSGTAERIHEKFRQLKFRRRYYKLA